MIIALVTLLFSPISVIAQSDDVSALLEEVEALYDQGKYAEATPLAVQAVEITEGNVAPDHPDLIQPLWWLGNVYSAVGRYDEAEPLYKRTLRIEEATIGHDNLDVAGTLLTLAALYYTQGRYDAAEPLYKRSLTIREKALGPEHSDVGQIFNNLASLYEAQGRKAGAFSHGFWQTGRS